MPKQKLIDRAIDITEVAAAYLTKAEYDTLICAFRAAKRETDMLDWLLDKGPVVWPKGGIVFSRKCLRDAMREDKRGKR